jgi:hypothetical protein
MKEEEAERQKRLGRASEGARRSQETALTK